MVYELHTKVANFIDGSQRAQDILNEAIGYQKRANALVQTDYDTAVWFNGLYKDTAKRLYNLVRFTLGSEDHATHLCVRWCLEDAMES